MSPPHPANPPVSILQDFGLPVAPCRAPRAEVDAEYPPETARWFVDEIRPHEAALRNYLRHRFPGLADPDDLVQETYLRLLRARAGGKSSMSKSYLFTVARSVAFDLYRRSQVVRMEPLAEVPPAFVMTQGRDAAESASHDQEIQLLTAAIASLPERCRAIVTLRKIDGLTHREIAGRLGIAENTVNAHITLGMTRLRDWLRAHGVTAGPRP